METVLSMNGNLRSSIRNLFDRDADGNYTVKNEEYSNEFKTIFRETLNLNYRMVQKTYNLTLGRVEPTDVQHNVYTVIILKSHENEVVNLRRQSFSVHFGRRKFARLIYRGRTEQPSISQMQPVKNNTDLMNETAGNPTLNPAFNHIRLMYSDYNAETFRSYSFGVFEMH